MDLIYQNADRIDQGVMKHYEMDLAYGKNENDFELSVDADNHCLEKDYILYMEGTEYGGIVDAVQFSNIDDTVTYSGRTWHGILEGKLFDANGVNGYMLINANANKALKFFINIWGLDDLFCVEEKESAIEIVNYVVNFEKGYTGIRKMLFEFGGKLKMVYKNSKVVLSAEPYMDYSQDEEFDSSQVYFTAKKNYRPLNHLACLGLGEENEQYVIHLFYDEYGGLQAYASTEFPVKDSDYILDISNKKLHGMEEVSDILDCGSVQARENYVVLNEMPSDWGTDANIWNDILTDIYTMNEEGKFVQSKAKEKTLYELQLQEPGDWLKNYSDYYVKDEEKEEGDGYKKATFDKEDVYTPQAKQPADWKEEFSKYYYLVGSKYKKVEPVIKDNYILCNIKPPVWELLYKNFYQQHSDGINITYEKVKGISKYRYVKQTSQPSDWDENYKSYYQKSGKKYISNPPKYEKQSKKPTNWAKNYSNYYQRISDGTEVVYRQVSSVTKTSYELQTQKPSDWGSNYNQYYEKNAKGKYIAVSIKKYVALTEQPSDWDKKYADYFYIYSDGTSEEYRSTQGVKKDNYVLQTSEPTDWSSNYDRYYQKNSEGKYVAVSIKSYVALDAQPEDWQKNYTDYFYVYSDGTSEEYRSIEGIKNDNYILQTAEPTDWSSNYDRYYYFNGTEYKKVKGVGEDEAETAPAWSANSYYTKETVTTVPEYTSFSAVYRKEDTPVWSANMYYTKSSITNAPSYTSFSKVYCKGDAPSWKKETYYTQKTEQKAPSYDSVKPVYEAVTPRWNACARYSRNTIEVAPDFEIRKYYILSKTEEVPIWKKNTYYILEKIANPQWEENTFYTKVKKMVSPVWSDDVYYQKFLDHYAGLVESGIEYLNKNAKKDELSIELEPDIIYDINDIIGANDNITKQSVWMPITKKIVKITENTETVEYEVGE